MYLRLAASLVRQKPNDSAWAICLCASLIRRDTMRTLELSLTDQWKINVK